jgi:hypothetical protein
MNYFDADFTALNLA